MSPAIAATAVPSRSQIQSWDAGHLEQAASRWRQMADEAERLFEQHQANIAAPGDTSWTGQAKDAAYDRVTADLSVVRKQSEVLRGAATTATRGAEDVRGAQRKTLESIADAEGKGFTVSEDLSVTDGKSSSSEDAQAKRAKAAKEHAEFIRWRASVLLAADTKVGDDLAAKAAELEGITFVSQGRDGTVHMLDDDDRKSPKDRAEEEKKEHSEPRTPPPDEGSVPKDAKIEGGTPGPDPYPGGLGDPVAGTSLDEQPKPPAWEPKDAGTIGQFKTLEPNLPEDQFDKWEVDAAREWMRDEIPHAARNMDHYFDVSGAPLAQDVKQMLKDIPDFNTAVDQRAQQLGSDAIGRAQALGANGPMTFPINTDWQGSQARMNSTGAEHDWFLASGRFDYNLSGQVTVFPPSDGRDWRYEMSTDVNTRDRYNWDISKSTPIAGTNITDAQMARFQLIGWAKEFTMGGHTGIWRTGG
ncbi:putative conserved membrane protein [Mycobacteroides abscessus subsp. abscessus]|uniref:WXG100 family type VII secretion target n=1 Tax=Mycobacteroides abscessus TaxID=36809 RepID=UPI00092C5F3D|nr:hypothetical protein [Mycobacteroides abscessus]SHR10822.1 putative conserved membrane protein [Mycobacteroides abscessus subsp. abscessus]